jgi:hypothetical protein
MSKRKKHKLEIDVCWLIMAAAIVLFLFVLVMVRMNYCSENNYYDGIIYDTKMTDCYCGCGISQECGVFDVFWNSKTQKCVSTFANPIPFSCEPLSWDSQYKKECDLFFKLSEYKQEVMK